ncbi:uncharacterized protein BX663DRAFT_426002, partial [Cokeromyces recurvatus]|uniref:uncharacterized protein n=1 Tax=Cokeromyces recurvatus TaxID=90255 RepID=UPI00221EFEAD
KKRKKDDHRVLVVNARIGTRNEHFLQFISGVLDTADAHTISSLHLILDNVSIYEVSTVQDLIKSRTYKSVYFLNSIELFWSKKRDCLTAIDDSSAIIIETVRQVSVNDYQGWIKHSVSFFR